MNKQVPASSAGNAVLALVDVINDNRDYLSDVDGSIGDGDHGVNMSTGFTRFRESLGDVTPGISEGLDGLGTTLLTVTGGSLGPLYGTMFLDMADAVKGAETIDAARFSSMINAGLTGVQGMGDAKPGDKTMVDALAPAAAAFDAALQRDATFCDCLAAMAQAAEDGKEFYA